jgi:hypothetical protein
MHPTYKKKEKKRKEKEVQSNSLPINYGLNLVTYLTNRMGQK